ncbi:MAG: bifunctional folylpolyglutamate synthase/dihydrofolate synthase [Acidobacteriia bacterium]|nr:bifunctional folylpolyglutamate synthase/dihydrofolate synthase [Terriglobia bacterium]
MNYAQAISFLNSLGNEITTAKLGLGNMRTLLNFLGHPQKKFPAVLIAGTNGKGSVAAFTESIMREAGYRTGLYTSPHLIKVEERIRVYGEQITQNDFARLTKKVRQAIEALLFNTTNETNKLKLQRHPTHFEILTAIALLYFAERQVEIAVVEVGLGGRLDATNIIDPVIAVITSISLDHQAYLGQDLESITREKIGIIKRMLPNQYSYSSYLPVVCSSTNKTVIKLVKQQCKKNQAQFISAFQDLNFKILNNTLEKTLLGVEPVLGEKFKLKIPLPGPHQVKNVLAAIQIIEILNNIGFKVSASALEKGVSQTSWPGRLEIKQTSPQIIMDGAHNTQAAKSVRYHIANFLSSEKVILIYGSLRDKDITGIMSNLAGLAREVILTQPKSERSATPQEILEKYSDFKVPVHLTKNVEAAWLLAHSKAKIDDTILVLGSLYLIGEIKQHLSNT